jgi:hypothetical protein
MSVPRLRRRHPREIVVLQAFGERVRAGFVPGACANLLILSTRAQPSLNGAQPSALSTKSERREADCAAPMGRGATAMMERLAASLGQGRPLRALPPLSTFPKAASCWLASALGQRALAAFCQVLSSVSCFYGLTSIFLLLAFVALGRLRSIEALRYHAPGEWGKLLGLDRALEVRTLRIKLKPFG